MLFGDNMYVGNTAVDAVYLGDTQVWSAIPADVKAHIARVTADGGTVPEQSKMVAMVKKLIAANLWNNCVFFGLPLGGVKKDGNQYVNKVYDLKANADLSQATGTAQPKYNSDGSLLYDSGDMIESYLLATNNPIKDATSNLTVIFWTKIISKTSGQMLLNRYNNTAGTFPFLIGTDGASFTKLRLHIRNGSLNKHYNVNIVIADGNWHHIAMTFSNNTLRGYVDGIEGAYTKLLDSTMPTLLNSSNAVKLGNTAGNTLNGTQTALHQIYNTTFTPEQTLWNYNNIRPEGV